ncbi:glycosyltransferase family 25 protein [Emticicia fluvialis]|uniref:glycosyltransferase family 25 protein n=1 Tax=Emticicia fluvialis TaxID=2974474 RepID=UPI002166AF86|nr:glycosyltransferase family 25 protein [Emticicia fluvialis]
MNLLNKHFRKVLLLNLDTRKDRLEKSEKILRENQLEFERFAAINGHERPDIQMVTAAEIHELPAHWNRGALGVCLSLLEIFRLALKENWENVLIIEDDIEFLPELNELLPALLHNIPARWESLFFGINTMEQEKFNGYWEKINYGFALHCHAVHRSVYQLLIDELSKLRGPADVVYANVLFPRGLSFVSKPKLAFQRADMSSVTNRFEDYTFLRNQY